MQSGKTAGNIAAALRSGRKANPSSHNKSTLRAKNQLQPKGKDRFKGPKYKVVEE